MGYSVCMKSNYLANSWKDRAIIKRKQKLLNRVALRESIRILKVGYFENQNLGVNMN